LSRYPNLHIIPQTKNPTNVGLLYWNIFYLCLVDHGDQQSTEYCQ